MDEHSVSMGVTYDAEADAAYVYLVRDIGVGGVAKTVPVDPSNIGGMVNIDLGPDGRILGMEVMDASSKLPESLLGLLRGDA